MKLDMLDALGDADLQAIIARAQGLLKQHDTERKDKALADARATLAAVGLTLKDLARKPAAAKPKGPVYRAGQIYQHPTNKALTWPGKGKKPAWLTTLEAEGGRAMESPATDNAPVRKVS